MWCCDKGLNMDSVWFGLWSSYSGTGIEGSKRGVKKSKKEQCEAVEQADSVCLCNSLCVASLTMPKKIFFKGGIAKEGSSKNHTLGQQYHTVFR